VKLVTGPDFLIAGCLIDQFDYSHVGQGSNQHLGAVSLLKLLILESASLAGSKPDFTYGPKDARVVSDYATRAINVRDRAKGPIG